MLNGAMDWAGKHPTPNSQHSTSNHWIKLPVSVGRWMFKIGCSAVQFLLLGLIQVYRWTISPLQTVLFGPQAGCRFTPTCSQYAAEAVRVHGAAKGSWLAARRICRCHPWGECGHDPVPKVSNFEFQIPSSSNHRLKTHNLKLGTPLKHGS